MMGTSSIGSLDTGLRGAGIALFLLIAVAVLRQGGGRPVAWLGAALSIGAAAYALCSMPDHPRSLWFAPLGVICAGNVVVFWLFTRAAFDDSFRPTPWHGAWWLLLVVCSQTASFGIDVAANWPIAAALRLVPVAFVLLAVVQTVTGWRGDLVERRRRLRLFVLAAVVLHTAVSATIDISIGPDHVPPAVHLLNAAALSLIAAVIAVVLLQADLAGFLAEPVQPAPATEAIREEPPAEPVDPAMLGELERLMSVERLYRREGLTIGDLAAKLGLPEHRLRRVINRGLGFRNFNEYLNSHRLADARQALADPTQRDVPILTIALDAGFQSLSPFNRAFKADTGMTPTEFRRQAGGAGCG
ncbi:MAG: helix-turn-helix domain-containing protein [Reyranella sp.]